MAQLAYIVVGKTDAVNSPSGAGMGAVAGNLNPWIDEAREACGDEEKAVAFWERNRGWEDSPACPRCGDTDVYKMEADARHRWRCRGCCKQYTVRIGTIMEDSKIPLRHWTLALWLYSSSKKDLPRRSYSG